MVSIVRIDKYMKNKFAMLTMIIFMYRHVHSDENIFTKKNLYRL